MRTEATWFDGTRADYARMLEGMDGGVGRVLAAFDRLQLAQDTLVIFTNDNGGERLSRNAPFCHNKATLWEGGISRPVSASLAATHRRGRRIEPGRQHVRSDRDHSRGDGNTAAAKRPPDGLDLLPLIDGRATSVDRPPFWRIDRPDRRQRAVRLGRWKYLRDGAIDMLFDLDGDPGERDDRSYHEPARLADLRARVTRWEQEVDASAVEFPMNVGAGGVVRPNPPPR